MSKFLTYLLSLFYIFTCISAQSNNPDIDILTAEIDSIGENRDSKKAELYNKLAYQQWEAGEYTTAIAVFKKSIIANQKIGNENALKTIYTNIGMIHSDKEDYESALLYFRKSLIIREKLDEPRDIASELINISISLQQLDRHYEAIKKTEAALELAKTINDIQIIRRCYGVLAESHEKVGEAKKSMEYFSLYATVDRHIQKKNIEKTKQEAAQQVTEANTATELAKKEKEATEVELKETAMDLEKTQRLTKLQQTKLKLQELEIRERDAIIRHKSLLNKVYIGGIGFSFLIIFLVYRNYRLKKTTSEKLTAQNTEIRNQQTLIEKKNLSITQSISYAQRIQEAMLPSLEVLHEKLPDSFVFFKPRDVVSGDFYWLSTDKMESSIFDSQPANDEEDEDIFIAAADCTGHGVPGAFMSMIGYNLLTEIVSRKIYNPKNILESLNIGVKNALKQEKTQNSDGMDIGICRIRKKAKIVEYSGAMNPLYYIQNGKMHEIEGGVFPVGGDELDLGISDYPYEQIKVESPTTFYIFSDGFQDQFGGVDGFKFMSKKFKEYLFEIHDKPMQEQKELLNEKLTSWMGNHEQVDDILIIGFKL